MGGENVFSLNYAEHFLNYYENCQLQTHLRSCCTQSFGEQSCPLGLNGFEADPTQESFRRIIIPIHYSFF